MTSVMSLSDSELRAELERLGFSPGPITDGTRPLYIRKLSELKKSSTSSSSSSRTPPSSSRTPPSSRQTTSLKPTPSASQRHDPSSVTVSPKPTLVSPPPSSAAVNPQPNCSTATKTSCAQDVVDCLLQSLDPSHVAMDTIFLFPNGEMLGTSRGVLATQCPAMVPMLYNREELYLVTVVAVSGQSLIHVRPGEYITDLKEKLSLFEGVPVAKQRLFLNSIELADTATLLSSGVTPGSTVQLELVHSITQQQTTKVVNPALSISHLSLKLGLERLIQRPHPPAPPLLPIPPHTMHIVHVYDVPSAGFRMLIGYLYTRQLAAREGVEGVADLLVCYVLARFFGLPSLSELCLVRVKALLDGNTVSMVAAFGEQLDCQPLVQLCKEYITEQS